MPSYWLFPGFKGFFCFVVLMQWSCIILKLLVQLVANLHRDYMRTLWQNETSASSLKRGTKTMLTTKSKIWTLHHYLCSPASDGQSKYSVTTGADFLLWHACQKVGLTLWMPLPSPFPAHQASLLSAPYPMVPASSATGFPTPSLICHSNLGMGQKFS